MTTRASGPAAGGDRAAVGDGAQDMDAHQVRSRDGEPSRGEAGREHQGLEPHGLAVVEPDRPQGRIGRDHAAAEMQGDTRFRIPFAGPHEARLERRVAAQHPLGQGRPLVGRMGFVADQGDRPGVAARPQCHRQRAGGVAGARHHHARHRYARSDHARPDHARHQARLSAVRRSSSWRRSVRCTAT
jgi:hypothetical protein